MVRARARSGGDVARQRHHEDRKATPRRPSASRHREPLAEAPRVGQLPQSSVNPTFIVTCQYATLLFSIAPRTSLTWNQRRLWKVQLRQVGIVARTRPELFDRPVGTQERGDLPAPLRRSRRAVGAGVEQ